MSRYTCSVCGYVYDEEAEGAAWEDLPDGWACPICTAEKAAFEREPSATETPSPQSGQTIEEPAEYLAQWKRNADEAEPHMADIHRMAATGESIFEPMRTRLTPVSWDDILIKGAQLARLPLNEDEPVDTRTVIGPKAKQPLVIETPVYVTHMSFGALSREVKLALARAAPRSGPPCAPARAASCPSRWRAPTATSSNTSPTVQRDRRAPAPRADAIEIKIGQSAKPGMGGHLPGGKVTEEIAAIRGRPAGKRHRQPGPIPRHSDAARISRRRWPGCARRPAASRSASSSPRATSRPIWRSPC